MLKQWAHCDEQVDDEKTNNDVELDLSSEELGDLLSNSDGVSQQVRQELSSIFGNAESEAYELAIASFLSSNPPTEFFFEESMPEDIKVGLFTPSVSFEQFKEDWKVLNEDSDDYYDEDAEYDAFYEWEDNYVHNVLKTDDEVRDFFYNVLNANLILDCDYDYTIEIPDEIVNKAEE